MNCGRVASKRPFFCGGRGEAWRKHWALGGAFIRAQEDPAALAAWYQTHLGINAQPPWMQAAGPTVLSFFARDDDYFDTDQAVMLNFRVDDLTNLVARLQRAGVAVETRPEWDSEIGRFVRIVDPEGNAVELWEPPAAAP